MWEKTYLPRHAVNASLQARSQHPCCSRSWQVCLSPALYSEQQLRISIWLPPVKGVVTELAGIQSRRVWVNVAVSGRTGNAYDCAWRDNGEVM